MQPKETDRFMNNLLKSRISRRVIAEQHLALTETFNSPWHFPDAQLEVDTNADFIGEVFLRCSAREVVQACWDRVSVLAKDAYGPQVILPELKIEGHLNATFPYILSHLQYIVGELLRNSIQALVELRPNSNPPPIEVLICEAPKHVIFRISDQVSIPAPFKISVPCVTFHLAIFCQSHLTLWTSSHVSPSWASSLQATRPFVS